MLPSVAFANHNEETTQEGFRLSDDKFSKINELLNKFVGTKNFHNYTSKKRWNDPSASRYIMSFVCEKPFLSNGVEFVVLKVKGNYYLLTWKYPVYTKNMYLHFLSCKGMYDPQLWCIV